MSGDEVRQWHEWLEAHARTRTDAVTDEADPIPAALDAAQLVRQSALHPKNFVTSIVLNR
jgi:hypothetical protein